MLCGQTTHRARMGLGLTDWLHLDPWNGSEKHRRAHCFCARSHAMQHACPEGCSYAAMRGCSPRLKHASGEDWTWSHGSVAARPIEWQQESLGRSPFPRACSLCTVHVLSAGCLERCADARYAMCMSGLRRRCNSQIRVMMLEDLVVFCNQFIHVSHSILMLCKPQQI